MSERSRQPLPYGCLTGLAKEALHNIRRAALGARAKDFLTYMVTLSFGDAGWAQRRGDPEPGLTCAFRLAEWAQELGWHKSDVLRIRKQIVELNVVSFTPDPEQPGGGMLRWNTDFASWRALDADYRLRRYTRPNAGRKPRSVAVSAQQTGIGSLIPGDDHCVGDLIALRQSNHLHEQFKLPTADGSESGLARMRSDAPRKAKKTLVKKWEGDAGGLDITPHSADIAAQTADRFGGHRPSWRMSTRAGWGPGDNRDEVIYVESLIAAMRARLQVHVLPSERREREAARWFYRARDGDAAPVTDVLAFYDAMKQRPFWASRYVSLEHVEGPYAEHRGDVAVYRRIAGSSQRREGRTQYGRPHGADARERGAAGAASGGAAATRRTGKYAGVYNVIHRSSSPACT